MKKVHLHVPALQRAVVVGDRTHKFYDEGSMKKNSAEMKRKKHVVVVSQKNADGSFEVKFRR